MLPLLQVCLWVRGRSLHDSERNRHVPDYSCCRPELRAHREERELFLTALIMGEAATIERLLLMFMGRMLQAAGPSRNTGGPPPKK